MATNIPVTLEWGTLPSGVNFPDYQTLVNEVAKIVTAYLPGAYSPINYGSTTPTADNQDRPWVRTNVDGSPDRTYTFFNGKWVCPHPITASSSYRALWVGSLANLYSFDGGDGTDPTVIAPTTTTGAMWQEDTDFQDRIPVGVLAATGMATSVGTNAGAKEHTLTALNIPEHFHYLFNTRTRSGSDGAAPTGDYSADRVSGDFYGGNRQYAISGSEVASYTPTLCQSSKVGEATPDAISIVPQVRGVYIIKRTARVYYTV